MTRTLTILALPVAAVGWMLAVLLRYLVGRQKGMDDATNRD